jgi:hypothetical protein
MDWHARLVERAGIMLGHTAATTPADKLAWCPNIDGVSQCRSGYAQINECVVVNDRFATLLSGGDPGPMSLDDHFAYESPAAAQEAIVTSATNLAKVIRGLDPDALNETITTPRGTITVPMLLEIALANMHYHVGQINYIQLLYGDTEFRFPEGFE